MSDATMIPAAKPTGVALGTGRRKTAVARVRIRAGEGKIEINSRPLDEFFNNEKQRQLVLAPLIKTGARDRVNVWIRVNGGGITGQADACKLGIARALKRYEPEFEPALRELNLLTRDSRMKERKHYGLRGARRGTQFSKR
jgi:small subunit ribosomal protein S9